MKLSRKISTIASLLLLIGCGGLTGNSGSNIGVPTGTILVADMSNGHIVSFNDMSGAGWTTFGIPGNGIGQLRPTAVTIGPDKRIYIADGENSRLVRIDNMSGEGWTVLDVVRPDNGQPMNLSNIEFDNQGFLYYSSDSLIIRIDDFSGANPLFHEPTNLLHVYDFAIAADGRIVVGGFDKIAQVDNIDGSNYVEYTLSHTPNDELVYGLITDNNGKITYAHGSNRLSSIDDISGTNMTDYSIGAYSLDRDSSGNFYLGSTGRQVRKYASLDSSQYSSFGTHGSGMYHFGQISDICIAP